MPAGATIGAVRRFRKVSVNAAAQEDASRARTGGFEIESGPSASKTCVTWHVENMRSDASSRNDTPLVPRMLSKTVAKEWPEFSRINGFNPLFPMT
jgi:hypothetical protein